MHYQYLYRDLCIIPTQNGENEVFETLLLFRLQRESEAAVLQRIVYVEKCASAAYDLLVVQAPKPRGTRYFEKPGFVRRKERFSNGLQAIHSAEALLRGYLTDGWHLTNSEQMYEQMAS
ncbi:hypothetical protein [Silvibacterium acidisoli]|uniref:hypothetical protein n=1 Tax=Acidobacteriaceae bacterium ZG23-2 TaxID=2883246 RepID=UPI00406CC42C